MSGPLAGARVLVTGGEGFTGRHLITAVRQAGGNVAALSRSDVKDADFPVHQADICDAAAVIAAVRAANPTHIVHLAAISETRRDDETIYTQVNVDGARHVLDAARDVASNLRHVTLASSAAVYGNPGTDPVSEDRAPSPANAYGRSKLEMERLAASYDLPTLCLRPFNYTGPGQPEHFIVPKLVKAFSERQPKIELWETVSVREFGDVRDAVAAYVALMSAEVTGVLNLCTGAHNSVGHVIETLRELTGHNPEIVTTGTPGGLSVLVGNPACLRAAGASAPKHDLGDTLGYMLARLA